MSKWRAHSCQHSAPFSNIIHLLHSAIALERVILICFQNSCEIGWPDKVVSGEFSQTLGLTHQMRSQLDV